MIVKFIKHVHFNDLLHLAYLFIFYIHYIHSQIIVDVEKSYAKIPL